MVEGQFQSRLDALKENSFAETELQHAEQDMAREMLIRDFSARHPEPQVVFDAAGWYFLQANHSLEMKDEL